MRKRSRRVNNAMHPLSRYSHYSSSSITTHKKARSSTAVSIGFSRFLSGRYSIGVRASLTTSLFVWVSSSTALAQSNYADGRIETRSSNYAIAIGDWQIKPLLEIRSQAELRHGPNDAKASANGDISSNASSDASSTDLVATTAMPALVDNQWWVLSRGRFGLAAERGPASMVVELQDARYWGESSSMRFDLRDSLPSTSARLAYAEIHGFGYRSSFVRLGRQQIEWGDGRLLGGADWSPTGRSLDALRGQLVLGDFDIEAFASLLVGPGVVPVELQRGLPNTPGGNGVQLHGLRVAWHIAPLLNVESNNVGRIARQQNNATVSPRDLFVSSLRISGSYPGISYAVEGAYELGNGASSGASSSDEGPDRLRAWAVGGKARYEMGVLWNLGFGIEGAYSSGQNSSSNVTRFEPVLPDTRPGIHHSGSGGAMGILAWSNAIQGAGSVSISPSDDTLLILGYRYLALAEPDDMWRSASLVPVGSLPGNNDSLIGHELDARIEAAPWAPVDIVAGYSALLTGDGAKNVLEVQGLGRPNIQHYGYLQITMRMR